MHNNSTLQFFIGRSMVYFILINPMICFSWIFNNATQSLQKLLVLYYMVRMVPQLATKPIAKTAYHFLCYEKLILHNLLSHQMENFMQACFGLHDKSLKFSARCKYHMNDPRTLWLYKCYFLANSLPEKRLKQLYLSIALSVSITIFDKSVFPFPIIRSVSWKEYLIIRHLIKWAHKQLL